jgi:hypothetical protein
MRDPTKPGDVLSQAMICIGVAIGFAGIFVLMGEGKSVSFIGFWYWLKIFGFIASFPITIYVVALITENPDKWYAGMALIVNLVGLLILSLVALPFLYMLAGRIYRESHYLFFLLCWVAYYLFTYWVATRRKDNDQ